MSLVEEYQSLRADALRDAMNRAARLASNGPHTTNPRVGCIIMDGERIVSEGWHRGAGTPHAEIDALNNLDVASTGLTAIVTLEPCNHYGRTGPCTQALLEAGITRVVYGAKDPFEGAGGAQTLERAGIDVEYFPTSDTHRLLAQWQASKLDRPVITVRWAQSLDGRIAAADGTSQWITGDASRNDVHRRRACHDAIAVGTGTVLTDDPSLTARLATGDLLVPATEQPRPVIFGRRDIPESSALNSHPRSRPIRLAGDNLAADVQQLLSRGITSVFVEGGPTLISAFLAHGLVDDVLVYTAPVLLGGPHTATAAIGVETLSEARRLEVIEHKILGNDQLIHARINHHRQEETHVHRTH